MLDLEAMVGQVVEAAKGMVERATIAIGRRVDALEVKIGALPAPEKGDRGEKGEPGENGARGEDGSAGKDADTNSILKEVVERIDEWLRNHPPKNGIDGANGKDGRDGEDADLQAVRTFIELEVEKRIALIPQAKNGEDGRDGLPGVPGRDGAPGGKGADGTNGADGFGLGDFDATLGEDGRTITLAFSRGDVLVEKQIKLAVILDQGVYKADSDYQRGDAVSHGGSLWIAQRDAPGVPGTPESGWRLAVKKGRDGKDADYKAPEPAETVRLR